MKKRSKWEIETINVSDAPVAKKPDGKLQSAITWVRNHWKRLLIVLGIIYAVLFTYGVTTTRFYTDENGAKRAYRMSIADFKTQDDYHKLTEHFSNVRNLLVDITIIDIHLANGELSNYEAATLYTAVLNEQLDVMIPKIKALNVQDEQKPIQEALGSILSYDLALYLQSIAEGLKSGSNEAVSKALTYRDKALKTYSVIADSLKVISGQLHMNDASYYDWKLSDAVVQKDKTAVLRTTEGG